MIFTLRGNCTGGTLQQNTTPINLTSQIFLSGGYPIESLLTKPKKIQTGIVYVFPSLSNPGSYSLVLALDNQNIIRQIVALSPETQLELIKKAKKLILNFSEPVRKEILQSATLNTQITYTVTAPFLVVNDENTGESSLYYVPCLIPGEKESIALTGQTIHRDQGVLLVKNQINMPSLLFWGALEASVQVHKQLFEKAMSIRISEMAALLPKDTVLNRWQYFVKRMNNDFRNVRSCLSMAINEWSKFTECEQQEMGALLSIMQCYYGTRDVDTVFNNLNQQSIIPVFNQLPLVEYQSVNEVKIKIPEISASEPKVISPNSVTSVSSAANCGMFSHGKKNTGANNPTSKSKHSGTANRTCDTTSGVSNIPRIKFNTTT